MDRLFHALQARLSCPPYKLDSVLARAQREREGGQIEGEWQIHLGGNRFSSPCACKRQEQENAIGDALPMYSKELACDSIHSFIDT